MFALSDIKQPCLFIINTSLTPLVVSFFILDFVFLVTFAADDKKQVLQILSKYVLLLFAFENSIDVVDECFLFLRYLGLQEAHFMHDMS